MLLSPANLTYMMKEVTDRETTSRRNRKSLTLFWKLYRSGAYKNMNSIAPKKSTIEKLRIAF